MGFRAGLLDERAILYLQEDQGSSDIVLAENFNDLGRL